MKRLSDRRADPAIGGALGPMPGAGLGNLGAGLVLGVALGTALEVDGRKRRMRA